VAACALIPRGYGFIRIVVPGPFCQAREAPHEFMQHDAAYGCRRASPQNGQRMGKRATLICGTDSRSRRPASFSLTRFMLNSNFLPGSKCRPRKMRGTIGHWYRRHLRIEGNSRDRFLSSMRID
jgi:hypothetical protein